jgi:hypothetical protein
VIVEKGEEKDVEEGGGRNAFFMKKKPFTC